MFKYQHSYSSFECEATWKHLLRILFSILKLSDIWKLVFAFRCDCSSFWLQNTGLCFWPSYLRCIASATNLSVARRKAESLLSHCCLGDKNVNMLSFCPPSYVHFSIKFIQNTIDKGWLIGSIFCSMFLISAGIQAVLFFFFLIFLSF